MHPGPSLLSDTCGMMTMTHIAGPYCPFFLMTRMAIMTQNTIRVAFAIHLVLGHDGYQTMAVPG